MKFDKPQRQSKVGIVIMFTDTLQKFVRAMWVPLFLALYRMPAKAIPFVLLGVIAILAIIGLVAYLRYRNFTFFLDEEKQEFVVESGVFSKNKLSIRLDKIQQVNINQSVIQKLIGVYSLTVDTAGSNDKEVSIKAIDHQSAQILKARLLERETSISEDTTAEQEPEATQKPILKISLASLLKVGLTSNYRRSLAILVAFFFTLYDNIRDFVEGEIFSEEDLEHYINQGSSFGTSVFLVVFFGLFVLTFLVTLIRTLIKYYDFQIFKQKKSLHISYGLFAKKNTLLNPKKVQIVAYSQNFFQQKLNVFKIRIKQASSQEVKQDGKKEQSSFVEIPGADLSEKELILKAIYDKVVEKGSVLNPNYRYVLKGIYFGLLLPVAVFLLAGFLINEELQSFFLLIPFYVVIALLFIYLGFKNYRLFVSDDFIIKKSGAWDVQYEIIEPHKIQAITTYQYFWHKPSDVGHVVLHTAGGNIRFRFANFSQINQKINYWLYQVESSDKSWM